jgi:hypothetical protein
MYAPDFNKKQALFSKKSKKHFRKPAISHKNQLNCYFSHTNEVDVFSKM